MTDRENGKTEMKRFWELNKKNPSRSGSCDCCGMPCKSKKLRPDDTGGLSIFCKECITESRYY